MDLLQPILEDRLNQYNSVLDNELPSLPVRLTTLDIAFKLTS